MILLLLNSSQTASRIPEVNDRLTERSGGDAMSDRSTARAIANSDCWSPIRPVHEVIR